MSNIEESVLRQRVFGLSGLGLAEEQRTRKSINLLLSHQQNHNDLEACVEQLEIQAIRLGISILRHQTDQFYIANDIALMQSNLLNVKEGTEKLANEADQWKKRNEMFQKYEVLGDKILAAGPPVPELQSQIWNIEQEIESIDRQIEEERLLLTEEATRLAVMFDAIKSSI